MRDIRVVHRDHVLLLDVGRVEVVARLAARVMVQRLVSLGHNHVRVVLLEILLVLPDIVLIRIHTVLAAPLRSNSALG